MATNFSTYLNAMTQGPDARALYNLLKKIIVDIEALATSETTNSGKFNNHSHLVSGSVSSVAVSGYQAVTNAPASAASGMSQMTTTTLTLSSS